MKYKKILYIENNLRLSKVTTHTGIIFCIDKRNAERSENWQLTEATSDAGNLAKSMVQWGIAQNKTHALKLLNR